MKAPAVISFIAKSGTGKTTLIEKIIRILSEKGYRVSSIKHTDHDFEADIPGKDSWRHKKAGAYSTMLLSENKMAFFGNAEVPFELTHIISRYFSGSDIVIIEGFKDIKVRKIQLLRKDLNPEGLKSGVAAGPNLMLVCCDEFIEGLKIPQININEPGKIADFIERGIILETPT